MVAQGIWSVHAIVDACVYVCVSTEESFKRHTPSPHTGHKNSNGTGPCISQCCSEKQNE